MKHLRRDDSRFVFHLMAREKIWFCEILRRYPLVPLSHHRLSRGPTTQAHDEKLLEEAMSALKETRRQQVRQLLESAERFVKCPRGFELALTREEMEWLLQVFNDVRVGSWLHLGSPDPEAGQALDTNPAHLIDVALMELSGQFECVLLEVLDA